MPFLIWISPFPSGEGLPSRDAISSPSLRSSSVFMAYSESSLIAIVSSPVSART